MTAVETMTFKITLTRQEQAFLFLYQKAGRLFLCTRKLMHIVALVILAINLSLLRVGYETGSVGRQPFLMV